MTLPKNRTHRFNVTEEVKEKRDLSYQVLIGEEVNLRDKEGRNALYWAVQNRHTHNAKLLIEFESSLMVAPKLHALFHAIEEGHYALIILLIQSGISPNMIDKNGRSALMVAIEKEQFRTVCFLLRNGADLFQMDYHYDMALDYASRSECGEIRGFVEHVLAVIEEEERQKIVTPCGGCKEY
ncbi:ankyrin repeat domain-containing protein [Sulfurovum mangrovi]|uniref:ankyrin repeat domain-containing protein n=1 Tax=Sulfurovum mangrovi TaxID=2893889 RepID=UPI001E451709|nr:ankyrin repeat domain-containing protein [Sulfurovum mangrovi]UFH58303.1 ankyrin repeat domain-containing protein [Sulfurovum mangrovi]